MLFHKGEAHTPTGFCHTMKEKSANPYNVAWSFLLAFLAPLNAPQTAGRGDFPSYKRFKRAK